MSTLTNAGVVITGLIIANYLWTTITRKKHFPGPTPIPFLGNVFQLPRQTAWVKFAEWSKEYGPVFELSALGTRIIVLNSAKAAEDLLVKRGSIFADRPSLQMAGEIVGFKRGLALLDYDDDAKASRRFILQTIGPKGLPDYGGLFENATMRYLRGLRDTPEKWVQHLSYAAGAIILKIAYGYDVEEDLSDPYVALANDALDKFSKSTMLGEFPVDFLPILNYIPSWFPGVQFKKLGREWRILIDQLFDKPFEMVKEQMRNGTATPSFTYTHLDQLKASWDDDHIYGTPAEIIKATATSLYAGASDTTVSAMRAFFLAMLIYPEVQARAAAEVQEVVGSDRLPTLADRASLPYCSAVLKELYRWAVVGPLGVPHVNKSQDDVYEGVFIPKGTLVIANIWAITRDSKTYKNPHTFDPLRFLDHKEPETKAIFGYGRRYCPGVGLAEASMFIQITQMLAVFKLERTRDTNGHEIIPPAIWETGTISHPQDFACKIVPRSPAALELIR